MKILKPSNTAKSGTTNGLKSLILSAALGLTLTSCGTHYDKKEPQYEHAEDRKEIVISDNNSIYAVKDWSDTGSPTHFKDEDGNRLLGGIDIDSYTDLGDGRILISTSDQKGIYDFTADKYILKLDNYLNIDKIPGGGSSYVASKIIGGQTISDTVDINTRVVTYGELSPEPQPSRDISNIITLGDSLTAVPSVATGGEFYDIKDAHSKVIVKSCYKPINEGRYIYALTDNGFVGNTTTKQYKLHQVNTITNKDKVRIINEYEAWKYMP